MDARMAGRVAKGAGRIALISVAALVMGLPLVWMISTSFKMPDAVFVRRLDFWPDPWTWANYARAWELVDFPRVVFNSSLVGGVVTVSQLLSGVLAGYAFGRLRFPGRELIFTLYLGTMMIPNHLLLVPTYLLMRSLRMIDTYYVLTLPFLAHPFSAFFMRQFFLNLPASLEEAGRIDGCGRLGVLFRILIPASRPALAALAIIIFLFSWSDFVWPLIMTNRRSLRTVQVALSYFHTEMGVDWAVLMAGTAIGTLPMVLLFAVGQRYLVQGIFASGGGYSK